MYMLITDETNVNQSPDADFFIYGGIFLTPDQAVSIDQDVKEIRRRYNLAPTDDLKFDTRSRPDHIDAATHKTIKNDVIEACLSAKVRFIAYLVLHSIAANPKTTGPWALNSVLFSFNKFLKSNDTHGIVAIDRLPESALAYTMLKEKFQVGLTIWSGETVCVDRVLMYSTTCNGASHLSSAVDITLGSFRWVVNNRKKDLKNVEVPATMLKNIAHMMHYRESNGTRYIRDYGLILRPTTPIHPPYAKEYDDLLKYFSDLLN